MKIKTPADNVPIIKYISREQREEHIKRLNAAVNNYLSFHPSLYTANVARKAGLKPTELNGMLWGRRGGTFGELRSICDVIDADPDYIIGAKSLKENEKKRRRKDINLVENPAVLSRLKGVIELVAKAREYLTGETLTQRKIAEMFNVSPTWYSQIRNETIDYVTLMKIKAVATPFLFSPDWIITGMGPKYLNKDEYPFVDMLVALYQAPPSRGFQLKTDLEEKEKKLQELRERQLHANCDDLQSEEGAQRIVAQVFKNGRWVNEVMYTENK